MNKCNPKACRIANHATINKIGPILYAIKPLRSLPFLSTGNISYGLQDEHLWRCVEGPHKFSELWSEHNLFDSLLCNPPSINCQGKHWLYFVFTFFSLCLEAQLHSHIMLHDVGMKGPSTWLFAENRSRTSWTIKWNWWAPISKVWKKHQGEKNIFVL